MVRKVSIAVLLFLVACGIGFLGATGYRSKARRDCAAFLSRDTNILPATVELICLDDTRSKLVHNHCHTPRDPDCTAKRFGTYDLVVRMTRREYLEVDSSVRLY